MDSGEPTSIHNMQAFADPHFTDKETKVGELKCYMFWLPCG